MDNIEFLPERIRMQRTRHARLMRQGYLLAVAGVAMGVWCYMWQGRLSTAQGELDLLRERSATVQRQLDMRADLQKQQAELLIKERISRQLGSRVNPLDLMAELERLMPAGMSLMNLSLEAIQFSLVDQGAMNVSNRAAENTVPPGKDQTVNRIKLVITGIAPTDVDVANFIGQLSASSLFEDVNMGYARNTNFKGHLAREFQASCYIVR